jgi:GNAT superfamily N-acetyltransferase
VIDDLDTGQVVGVGSWFRNQGATAEVGLLVEDAFQHRGHGSALLDVLAASARHAGITTLLAHTVADARHVHGMLRRIGLTSIECSGITCTLHVALTEAAEALAG